MEVKLESCILWRQKGNIMNLQGQQNTVHAPPKRGNNPTWLTRLDSVSVSSSRVIKLEVISPFLHLDFSSSINTKSKLLNKEKIFIKYFISLNLWSILFIHARFCCGPVSLALINGRVSSKSPVAKATERWEKNKSTILNWVLSFFFFLSSFYIFNGFCLIFQISARNPLMDSLLAWLTKATCLNGASQSWDPLILYSE